MAGPHNYECETIDPDNPDGPKVTVIIPHCLYDRYYKYKPVRYENLRAVRHVLDYPKRILSGIRELNEGGWCYTGRPEQWCKKVGILVPFPSNYTFVVYMNSKRVIFEYGAEKAADNDSECPVDWDDTDRFSEGLLWTNTS